MKRAITMRAALADPHLLGSALAGDSWATWRVFLIACMGEKLNAAEREVFRRFTGREREPGARIEEALFLIGRRGGNDRASSVLAAYFASLVDWSGVLAKGERGLVLCIGADIRQAAVQRSYIEGVFAGSQILSSLVVNKTADEIQLSNNITVAVRAANFRRLRGVTCVAVIATESAFWLDETTSANADVQILNAVRPTLATTGGPLILITTPYARRGATWELYHRHYGAKGDPAVLIVQGTTRDFNSTLPQRVVDRALERDHAAAAAEYLAEFRSDLEAFVLREVVDAAVVAGRHELEPVRGVRYFGFTDPSGGSADSFTLAVCHREGDKVVVDCVRERRPPFSPDQVVQGEFVPTLKSYGISDIQSDRYGGIWPVEVFGKYGVRVEQSARAKSDLYIDILPLLNSGRIELLDHPRLVAQLVGLERRTARSGKDSIDHPPGSRDDVINSVAGAAALAIANVGVVVSADLLMRVMAMPARPGRSATAWGWQKKAGMAHMLIPPEERGYPASMLPNRFQEPTSEEGD